MPAWKLPILGIACTLLAVMGAIRLVAWMWKRPYRRMYAALLVVPVLSFASSFVQSMIMFSGITHAGEYRWLEEDRQLWVVVLHTIPIAFPLMYLGLALLLARRVAPLRNADGASGNSTSLTVAFVIAEMGLCVIAEIAFLGFIIATGAFGGFSFGPV